MTVTRTDISRSYGGGAVVSQLTQQMGPTDTSFTITPYHQLGPEQQLPPRDQRPVRRHHRPLHLHGGKDRLLLDQPDHRGCHTCLQRGADGTSPQSHYPNSNPSGVQTCWTSVEAQEANAAVSYLFGTTGPVPETDWVLTWQAGGVPEYQVLPTPIDTAVASGELYSTSTSNVTNNIWYTVSSMTAVNLSGGMTQSGQGLVIPTNGRYLVCGQAQINVTTDTVGVQAACESSTFGSQALYGGTSLVTSAVSGISRLFVLQGPGLHGGGATDAPDQSRLGDLFDLAARLRGERGHELPLRHLREPIKELIWEPY